MTAYNEERKKFVEWIKKTLSGEKLPIDDDGDECLITPSPLDLYSVGIIYPQEEQDDYIVEGGLSIEEIDKNFHAAYRHVPPSSIGFSFYVDQNLSNIRISYSMVRFKLKSDKPRTWKKKYIKETGLEDEYKDGISIEKPSTYYIKDEEDNDIIAKITTTIHHYGHGKIITISLLNEKQNSYEGDPNKYVKNKAENSLFEVELMCHFEKKHLLNYPRANKELLTEEEKELDLRYKNNKIYAIGHGTSANWSDEHKGNKNLIKIFSDFMPIYEVPQVTTDTSEDDSQVLNFEFLQTIQSNNQVFIALENFIKKYLVWIKTQKEQKYDDNEKLTAQKITQRMSIAAERMVESVSMLRSDKNAQLSFSLANQAMLMQMQRSRPNASSYAWRPFQLAFVLLVLSSAINEEDKCRDWVDLIWFPTGGGKTEAYLGIMAFAFVYRRLKYSSSGYGTTAIMRYTLRLLTAQQFVRASKVIFALELIRQQKTNLLGDEPFTVGLWVGGTSSPNTFFQAAQNKENLKFNKFIVNKCPWCDANFTSKNYIVHDNDFHFTCSNSTCDFGKKRQNILPFNVVDEALYKNPPTLLISTVDKFARFAWDKKSNVFLGGNKNRPPELIIQDELHLISGALGSIVGLYETGFEAAINSRGVFPKIIASTATIRQAKEQTRSLFGREVAIFPPVGLQQNDSYFAKEVPLSEKPGRLYVGYLDFNKPTQNCLENLAGALLAAPVILYEEEKTDIKDAWWTQMVYHSSIADLSNSQTVFQNQAAQHLDRLIENHFTPPPPIKAEDSNNSLPKRYIKIKSLKGTNSAEINTEIFNSLTLPFQNKKSLDVVLATNIVSVGLDEPRLALMVINGQPLSTSEYIQSSSRVGRGQVPGIVFVNYYKQQARSLSHYENFRAYHSCFYRFVEPTSLTPFTKQARNRALHAALVIAIRHGSSGLINNKDAGEFLVEDSKVDTIKNLIEELKKRIKKAMPEDIQEVYDHLDLIVDKWKIEALQNDNLKYNAEDRSSESLLFHFEDSISSFNRTRHFGIWPTLNSMRNVDKQALLEVNLDKNKFYNDPFSFTPIPFSKITTYSGVGSIVRDSANWLIKIKDTRFWPSKLIRLHATKRVQIYLKTNNRLLLPPEAQIKEGSDTEIIGRTIPSERFPTWMYCSSCHHLYHQPWKLKENNINEPILCPSCNGSKKTLVQTIWCYVGHYDPNNPKDPIFDVPWHNICHLNSNSSKECYPKSDVSYLKIENQNGKWKVSCTICDAKNDFEKFQRKVNNVSYAVMEVNDPRVYRPISKKMLVIPPESNIDKDSIHYKLQTNSNLVASIQNATRKLEKKREIKKVANLLKCSDEDLLNAIKNLDNAPADSFSISDVQSDEYLAFITPSNFPDGADFITSHNTKEMHDFAEEKLSKNNTAYLASKLIDQLVAVNRLRVINIFKGFLRGEGKQEKNSASSDVEKNPIIPPDIIGEADWYPSTELFGEGIFFTLNSSLLTSWEENEAVTIRANKTKERFKTSNLCMVDEVVPSARFIMLHTLAHLLMRELERFSGYSAASINERIYCSTTDKKMAGILIYSAVSDQVGTLGGIVQLAKPENFLRILDNALQQADWCSLDPVCGESDYHGPAGLNRAACHACSLSPDTSCNYKNTFLDRVFIKGNTKENMPSLLDIVREKNG